MFKSGAVRIEKCVQIEGGKTNHAKEKHTEFEPSHGFLVAGVATVFVSGLCHSFALFDASDSFSDGSLK
jgi:hypothetical protein